MSRAIGNPRLGIRANLAPFSLLERAGHRDLAVLTGGPDDWATASGHRLETGT